jgi:hypothetical protein
LPCFVVRKSVYQIISIIGKEMCVSIQLLHCRIHAGNFISLLATSKSSREVYQYLRMFVLTFTSHSVQWSINTKANKNYRQLTSFFFKLVVTVRCNFEGIFSSSNCPDQYQGPPSLPFNRHWGVLSSGEKVGHEVPFSQTLSVTSLCPKLMSPSLLACATTDVKRTDWLTNWQLQTTCSRYSQRFPKV